MDWMVGFAEVRIGNEREPAAVGKFVQRMPAGVVYVEQEPV